MERDRAKAAEQWKRWYGEHGAGLAAKKKAQRAANPGHYLSLQRAAYQRRLEEKRAYHRQWQQAHPFTARERFARAANQRTRKYGREDRLDHENLPDGPCVYCGRDDTTVTWDHVIPLGRGGANRAWNCVRSCLSCNRHKQAKTAAEWLDPTTAEARKERKRAYVRQWHRDHYAEVYARRKAKRQETGHW